MVKLIYLILFTINFPLFIVQAEELMELALAQKLREILSVEQEHAMDLRNALGK